ncbi:MAG: iron-containing redox enzyme family protein [Myxococcales bacterium]|nr:iron-containing redox enzyme family protein [Myxococcales bacterium]
MPTRGEFQEALLQVMERKVHWAWPGFNQGMVPRELLHLHLEQEYACYVRDFPLLIGRAYVQCPIAAVRRELAENLYEEETGGLTGGRPHPELFLEYPRGLGMDLARFDRVALLPAAAAYRAVIDDATLARGWEIAAAVTTLFIEGTAHERGEVEPNASKRPQARLSQHPLVKHYALPVEHLALTRAHRQVEGDHRQSAWRILLEHVPAAERQKVIEWMERALSGWLTYRDEVAEACGLIRGADGSPQRMAS